MIRGPEAKLVLEDGTILEGRGFGATGESTGEIVFNTSMTGYQEILSDPSYCGQMVVMTYPLIGNYGVNETDLESAGPTVSALIVKEVCQRPSNWRATHSLPQYLEQHGIVGIEGIDTRRVTRHIRNHGAMRAIISPGGASNDQLLEKVKKAPRMEGANLVEQVTCGEIYRWTNSNDAAWRVGSAGKDGFRVAVYDYGAKHNILRKFVERGCDVTVFPASTPAEELLNTDPDGIFLSNGPGDPDAVKSAIKNVKTLIGQKPVFGICLGHQILALAMGGKTFKMKFGHRGGNHPVRDLVTEKIEITSQNHGFAVDPDSLDKKKVTLTHVNLYDGTLEGIEHKELPAFAVQYHPEASPGPHDSDYLFDRFIDLIRHQ